VYLRVFRRISDDPSRQFHSKHLPLLPLLSLLFTPYTFQSLLQVETGCPPKVFQKHLGTKLNFYRPDALPLTHPTNSVTALRNTKKSVNTDIIMPRPYGRGH